MRFSIVTILTIALGLPAVQAAHQEYAVHLWESSSECDGSKKQVEGTKGENEGPTGKGQCLDINTRKYHSVSAFNDDTCCDFFEDYKCKGKKRSNKSTKPGACYSGFKDLGCVTDTKIKSFRCSFGG